MRSKKAVREERNNNINCDASIYKVVFVAVDKTERGRKFFFSSCVCYK
jgi:hypothetical protein